MKTKSENKTNLKLELKFRPRCDEWDARSMPCLINKADGRVVLEPKQFVGHPGDYDQRADNLCRHVELCVNAWGSVMEMCRCLLEWERDGHRGSVNDALNAAYEVLAMADMAEHVERIPEMLAQELEAEGNRKRGCDESPRISLPQVRPGRAL